MSEVEKSTKPEAAPAAEEVVGKSDEETPVPAKVEEPPKVTKSVTLEALFELLTAQSVKIDELTEKLNDLNLRAGNKGPAPITPLTTVDDGKLRIVEDYAKDKILLFGKKGSFAFKDSVFKPTGFTFTDRSEYGPAWLGPKSKQAELIKLLDKANAARRVKIEIKKTTRDAMDKLSAKAAALDDEDEEEVKPKAPSSKAKASAKKAASDSDDSDDEPAAKPKPAPAKKASNSPAKKVSTKKPAADSDDSDDEPAAKPKPAPRKLASKSPAKTSAKKPTKKESSSEDEAPVKAPAKGAAKNHKKAPAKKQESDESQSD